MYNGRSQTKYPYYPINIGVPKPSYHNTQEALTAKLGPSHALHPGKNNRLMESHFTNRTPQHWYVLQTLSSESVLTNLATHWGYGQVSQNRFIVNSLPILRQ